jgi:outer membrane protein assembly factor BamB
MADAGWYGRRAEALVGDPARFPLPPFLASLMVCEDPDLVNLLQDRLLPSVFERLRPYGGVLYLRLSSNQAAAAERGIAALGLENARIEQADSGLFVRRVGPLPSTSAWTHECADAARSYFSRDQQVKPPLGILWYGDGPDYGFWKEHDYGTGVKPQVVGGRLFALQISSRKLMAYDVFTGRFLWQAKVPAFTRYASLSDGIYVAGDNRCVVYDPATGRELGNFPFTTRPGRRDFVADVRVSDQAIVIATAPEKVRDIEKGLWDSTDLVALDRHNGRQLWTHQAEARFNNQAFALGAGLVFCVDSLSPRRYNALARRGQSEMPPSTVFALDERSGQTRWARVMNYPGPNRAMNSFLSIRGNDDWLAYDRELDLVLAGKLGHACGLEAGSGKEVWRQPLGGVPLILRGATFVNQAGQAFDARTGKSLDERIRFPKGGCNYAVANPYCLFVRDRSVSYIDLASRQKQDLYAVRSGCSNSLIAADGLLSVPNFSVGCVCNYPMQTCFAMFHLPEAARWLPATADGK